MRPVWSRRVGVGIFGGITAGTFCLGVWQAKRLSWKEGEVSYASGFWLAHRGGVRTARASSKQVLARKQMLAADPVDLTAAMLEGRCSLRFAADTVLPSFVVADPAEHVYRPVRLTGRYVADQQARLTTRFELCAPKSHEYHTCS